MTTVTQNALWVSILLLYGSCTGQAATRYVWTNSPSNGPGTAWTNAFHTIQSAVNTATNGDTVLVTNGTLGSAARSMRALPSYWVAWVLSSAGTSSSTGRDHDRRMIDVTVETYTTNLFTCLHSCGTCASIQAEKGYAVYSGE